jgi:PKD repeat protein
MGFSFANFSNILRRTIMKQLYRFVLLIALFWGFATPTAWANHIYGADLTWTCNQQNSCLYTFTYSKYVECPFSAVDPSPDLILTCLDPGSSQEIEGDGFGFAQSIVEVTPLCPVESSNCNGGTVPGVMRLRYQQTINLCTTPVCNTWDVYWEICCRSNQITSLNNPSLAKISSTSRLSFNQNICNSSPSFATDPIVSICNGQTSNFAMGATDPDGDQLLYSLQACGRHSNLPVNYSVGFSANVPMGPSWNVTLDANTGDLNFANISPSTVVGVVCMRVTEIRNGQVIGWVVRDIQVRVVNCNGNNLPTLTGFDGFPDPTTKACAGVPSCFTVESDDVDVGDNLSISLISGPPGMTLSTAGAPHPTATICWTPTANDIGINYFILEVRDDACPGVGIQQYTYTIEVGVCYPCDTVSSIANWTHTQNLLDVAVTNTSTGGAISYTSFVWGDGSPNQTFFGNWTAPVNHTFPASGIYNVCVKVYTWAGDVLCTDSLCKEIEVSDDGCFPHISSWTAVPDLYYPCTYHFTDNSSPASSQVYWNFGTGGGTAFGSPATHTFPGSGAYTITMTTIYTSPNAPTWFCTDTYTSTFNAGCKIKDEGSGSRLQGGASLAWNENTSTLRVELPQNDRPSASSVAIYDLSGKLLVEKVSGSGADLSFDLSMISAGIYLIRTSSEGRVQTQKFARP